MLPEREAASLRATFPRFLAGNPGDDLDHVAYAVKRLRAFLTGCGSSLAYIELAAQMLVDDCLGGGGQHG